MREEEILITGGAGQVGSELRLLFPNATSVTRQDFDLRDEERIRQMFMEKKPKVVIHTAAKVGGMKDNLDYPASYLEDNVLMNTLLLKHARLAGVERFVAILSSCIYPDTVECYPLNESVSLSGPPAPANFFYAYSKRLMAIQVDAYNAQYKTKYNYVIPCNLYGTYNKEYSTRSHFPLALLTKIKNAVEKKEDHIVLFGDGKPMRQFMHSRDLAKIIKIMIDQNIYESFNVAPEQSLAIDDIAKIGLAVANSEHLDIKYEDSTLSGQYRRDISTAKMKSLIGEYEFISLTDGLKEVYETL
jgi:GDP-L-fucose synthase